VNKFAEFLKRDYYKEPTHFQKPNNTFVKQSKEQNTNDNNLKYAPKDLSKREKNDYEEFDLYARVPKVKHKFQSDVSIEDVYAMAEASESKDK